MIRAMVPLMFDAALHHGQELQDFMTKLVRSCATTEERAGLSFVLSTGVGWCHFCLLNVYNFASVLEEVIKRKAEEEAKLKAMQEAQHDEMIAKRLQAKGWAVDKGSPTDSKCSTFLHMFPHLFRRRK